MLITELSPTYHLRANVRPVKHAYLFMENDTASLGHILKYVCTQWGGLRNLIIPVNADMEVAEIHQHLLRLHEPDRLVEYISAAPGSSPGDVARLGQLLESFWPERKVVIDKGSSFEREDRAAHPLGVIPDEKLRSEELLVYDFDGVNADDPVMLAVFGRIYPGQEKEYTELCRVASVPVGYSSQLFWSGQLTRALFGSPVNFTTYGVVPYQASDSLPSNHFDVVVGSSPSSIVLYWNLRATRESVDFSREDTRRTLLLPGALLSDTGALDQMAESIRPAISHRYASTNLHIRFISWDGSDWGQLSSILGDVKGLIPFSEKRVSVKTGMFGAGSRQVQDYRDMPLTYMRTLPALPGTYREGISRGIARITTLKVGQNQVLFEPPSRYHNRLGQEVSIDLECDVWKRYPRDPALASLIKAGSRFSRYGLTFAAGLASRATYLDFQLPGEWEVLRSWFAGRGYDVRESQPSKYASALVRLLGGLSQVDAIASKPAYLLLDSLALKSTKKLAQRIITVLQERGVPISGDLSVDIQPLLADMEIVPELQRVPRTYRQLCSNAALSPHRKELLGILGRLSEIQLVRRGFYLTCPNCGTPSWYPLEVVRETITCLGCSHSFALPVEKPTESEIQWEYTLNTLANRAVDQDVLPVLLAMRRLSRDRPVCSVVPGLELLQNGNVKVELDFTFLADHEISGGECKAGREIGAKDVAAARLVAQIGVNHFYFCTVSKFDDKSVGLIDGLRKQLSADGLSMDVSVIDGDQLLGEALA